MILYGVPPVPIFVLDIHRILDKNFIRAGFLSGPRFLMEPGLCPRRGPFADIY